MSQNNQIFLIVCLLAVLIGALAINYYFYQRQQAEEARRLKAKQVTSEVEQALGVLSIIKQLPCQPPLIALLEDHVVSQISLLRTLTRRTDLSDKLQGNLHVPPNEPLVLNSSSGVQLAQRQIREASNLLSKLKQSGRLTPILFNEYNQDLNWLYLLVEADAHIELGNKLMENNKTSIAITHFRQAKSIMTKASSKDPRKKEKIDEITKLVKGPGTPSAEPSSAETT